MGRCFHFATKTRHADAASALNAAIALQIRELRKARGWTQAELAERSGIHRSHISAMEQPTFSGWSTLSLSKLAAAFDVALTIRLEGWGVFLVWAEGVLCKPWAPPAPFAQDSEFARKA